MKELENNWMKKWESVKKKPSALLTSILTLSAKKLQEIVNDD